MDGLFLRFRSTRYSAATIVLVPVGEPASQPASQPPSSNLSIFFGMARDVRDAGSMDKKNE